MSVDQFPSESTGHRKTGRVRPWKRRGEKIGHLVEVAFEKNTPDGKQETVTQWSPEEFVEDLPTCNTK